MAVTTERSRRVEHYLRTQRPTYGWLGQMYGKLQRYGSLTEGQLGPTERAIEEANDRAYQLTVKIAANMAVFDAPRPPVVATGPAIVGIRNGRYRVEFEDGTSLSVKVEKAGWAKDMAEGTRVFAILGYGNEWDKLGFLLPDGKTTAWRKSSPAQVTRARAALEVVAAMEGAGDGYLLELNYAFEVGVDAGACVFCNRELNIDESTTAGYGEWCANLRGLPWGANSIEVEELRARVVQYRESASIAA